MIRNIFLFQIYGSSMPELTRVSKVEGIHFRIKDATKAEHIFKHVALRRSIETNSECLTRFEIFFISKSSELPMPELTRVYIVEATKAEHIFRHAALPRSIETNSECLTGSEIFFISKSTDRPMPELAGKFESSSLNSGIQINIHQTTQATHNPISEFAFE
ncbi:hypothetical protein CDAR_502281 [Caerostris darwini]|uniref:Uncharacterized protein n=1 Tax=Caerostris darwini TaxID=1538125 RepID=A0AAV4R7B1_9ARAC|nr:hypothetical protein CDAR_502281 [Caerostris darwini]